MDFYAVLDQIVSLLQHRGRVLRFTEHCGAAKRRCGSASA